MKAAFATWEKRIAPVFDVTRKVHLVETDGNKIIDQRQIGLPGELTNQKVLRLAELGVRTLICGAISNTLQTTITAYGIKVIPFVAGDLLDVIQAWMSGSLTESSKFTMPGSRRTIKSAQTHNTK